MDLLAQIRRLVTGQHYTLRPHAVRHAVEEGFDEQAILEAIGNGRILETYPGEHRCLVVGAFRASPRLTVSLHLIVDFWPGAEEAEWVDIVTAYIPRKPFWDSARRRGRRRRP